MSAPTQVLVEGRQKWTTTLKAGHVTGAQLQFHLTDSFPLAHPEDDAVAHHQHPDQASLYAHTCKKKLSHLI